MRRWRHFIDDACLDTISSFRTRYERTGEGAVMLEWQDLLARYDLRGPDATSDPTAS